MALKKMLKTTGCLKRNTLSRSATFHWQLSRQLAVEGQMPSNPVSEKGNLESAFLGHPLYIVYPYNICNKKSAPEFLKPSPVVWREIRSDGKTFAAVAAQV